MAKYKMTKKKAVSGRKSKKTGRRRRKVSGPNDGLMALAEMGAGVTLGAVAGRESATLIGGIIPELQANPLILGLVQLVGGMYLAKEMKGGFMQGLGYGLAANGGVTAVVSTGIISGVPGQTMTYQLNGIKKQVGNIRFVAGPTTRVGNVQAGQSNLAFVAGAGMKRKSIVG